jgi:small nuclear ribonucleoprotein (snRNP)-like protein
MKRSCRATTRDTYRGIHTPCEECERSIKPCYSIGWAGYNIKNSYIYYSTIPISVAAVVTRKFGEEALQFLGKKVSVETSDQKIYSGTLAGIDERLDVVLDNVEGHGILKVIINGSFVKEVRLMEKPFDFKALAERLSRIFPGLVKIREDVGAIIVMDKIKVTQAGIEEGSGLAADRVKAIYDEFTREAKK